MPETLDGRAKSIIDRVIDLDLHARIEILERECAGDVELGRRVESLLSAMEKDDAFLQQPTVGVDSIGRDGHASLRPGGRIGPYTILELIGEGGFGSVFLAEQTKPVRRQVALKIIKLGMDTRQVIARFEAERQALALMDHPNIARVLDVGATDSGRPYFVMELVRGEHITDYCDRQRLSIAERLALFRDICGAVQHAHQKGVIHRDLKPSNVLVTVVDGRAIPKVIDFGIAKATAGRLTDMTLHTAQHQLIGTPEYMSPEQAESSGADIDTRSDVYSLGVLLYELLTGNSPFSRRRLRSASFAEVQRILREEDPPRPSVRLATADDSSGRFRLRTRTDDPAGSNGSSVIEIAERRRTEVLPLTRAIRGDLDWIVLKCLEKDRARRYETASALADDIGRHLTDEPVAATPPSRRYRLRKFVRRNRASVAAGATFLLLLIVSTVVAWKLYTSAELARGVAADKTAEATGRLWDSLLAQARAGASSVRPGRRFESLEALRQAAAIRPAAELRDEAIACLALPDVAMVKSFSDVPNATAIGLRNPDRFAYPAADGDIRVIAVDDGRELRRLKSRPHLYVHLGFSPDGQFLLANYTVSVGKFFVEVWNLDSALPVIAHDCGAVDPVYAFSPTSEWIAIKNPDHLVHFYRLPTGEEFKSLAFGRELYRMQAHPGGAFMAVSSTAPPFLRVWDVVNDRLVSEFDMPAMAGMPSWSHDGRLLAAAGADTGHWRIYVWDFESRQLHSEFAGHQGIVTSLYFHPHADLLASRSWDFTSRFWDLRGQREVLGSLPGWFVQGFGDVFACSGARNEFAIWRFEPARELMRLWAPSAFGGIGAVRFATEGEGLVSAGRNGVFLWNVESGEQLAALDDQAAIWAEMLPDKKTILSATNEGLVRYSLTNDGTTFKGGEPELLWPQKHIRGCCLNPKDQTAIVSLPSELVFVDLGSGQERRRVSGSPGMERVSLSPSGRWIFLNNWKGSHGRIWDAESGETVHEFPGESVRGFFSPDGRWLLVANGPEFLLCESGSWSVVRRIQRLHADILAGMAAFSNDGTIVAVAHSRNVIQLIDLATGDVLATLPNPDQYSLMDLRFSRDDRWLVVATVDRLIAVWDLRRLRSSLRAIGLDWP